MTQRLRPPYLNSLVQGSPSSENRSLEVLQSSSSHLANHNAGPGVQGTTGAAGSQDPVALLSSSLSHITIGKQKRADIGDEVEQEFRNVSMMIRSVLSAISGIEATMRECIKKQEALDMRLSAIQETLSSETFHKPRLLRSIESGTTVITATRGMNLIPLTPTQAAYAESVTQGVVGTSRTVAAQVSNPFVSSLPLVNRSSALDISSATATVPSYTRTITPGVVSKIGLVLKTPKDRGYNTKYEVAGTLICGIISYIYKSAEDILRKDPRTISGTNVFEYPLHISAKRIMSCISAISNERQIDVPDFNSESCKYVSNMVEKRKDDVYVPVGPSVVIALRAQAVTSDYYRCVVSLMGYLKFIPEIMKPPVSTIVLKLGNEIIGDASYLIDPRDIKPSPEHQLQARLSSFNVTQIRAYVKLRCSGSSPMTDEEAYQLVIKA